MDKSTELQLLRQSILHCEACSLREGISAPVPMSGNTKPLVTVIGAGPDPHDIKRGVPWSGKVGYYTRALLWEAGIHADKVAWMNVVCCGPTPKQGHIDACRLNTRRQLQALNAPYTLILGSVALGALAPFKVSLKELRGVWWKLPPSGGWTMATLHPSATAHGYASSQEGVLKRDIQTFATSVTFGDLHKPKLRENCLRCDKWASHFVQGIPFCNEHVPHRMKKKDPGYFQMNLLGEL